jgi:nitroreductase
MSQRLADPALDQLFRAARTRNGWKPDAIPDALLREIYELAKLGPTSANSCPGRFVFLVSAEAKARLAPFMSSSNRPKTLAAPVNVILAYDLAFADTLERLAPDKPGAASWFAKPELAAETAFRNGSLQAAYLMLAARALGLDCGPMSGFDLDGVNREFFADTSWRVNFVCNLGWGTEENLFPRRPRLSFEEACRVL